MRAPTPHFAPPRFETLERGMATALLGSVVFLAGCGTAS